MSGLPKRQQAVKHKQLAAVAAGHKQPARAHNSNPDNNMDNSPGNNRSSQNRRRQKHGYGLTPMQAAHMPR